MKNKKQSVLKLKADLEKIQAKLSTAMEFAAMSKNHDLILSLSFAMHSIKGVIDELKEKSKS